MRPNEFPPCACGTMHPPLAPGEVCPMLGTKIDNTGKEDIEGLTNFFSTLKTILKSNIKDEDDSKKIFMQLIMLNQKYFDIQNEKKKG